MDRYKGRYAVRYSVYACCVSLLMIMAWGWGGVKSAKAEDTLGWDSLLSPVVLAGSSVDLQSVDVNVLAGWLTGTTPLIEYSLDSTDGINGHWIQADDTVTPIRWQPGYLYIREQADPTNNRLLAVIQLGREGTYLFADPTASLKIPTTHPPISDSVVGSADPIINSKTTPLDDSDTDPTAIHPLTTIQSDPSGTTSIQINNDVAIEQLTANSEHTLTIPVTSNHSSMQIPIEGSLLQALYDQKGTIMIVCPQVTYTLPIAMLEPQKVIQSFAKPPVSMTSITLTIQIKTPSNNDIASLQSLLNLQQINIVGSPVSVQLQASYDGQTIPISPQGTDQSLELTMPVPVTTSTDSISSKPTTAIVYQADHSMHPVPTLISSPNDSSATAHIHGWTNGIYALVSHHPSLIDTRSHWSSADVNDMASRLIVTGEKGGVFAPDRLVTRAEFAAMIVRALGLSAEPSKTTFSDVHDSDWYAGVIGSASNHGLIEGYNDTTFRPNQQITREEASEILSHAMKLTGLSTAITTREANAQLNPFADRKQVSNWAVPALALSVKYHILEGIQGAIQPQSDVSRAQATVMIRRLLQQSGWIQS